MSQAVPCTKAPTSDNFDLMLPCCHGPLNIQEIDRYWMRSIKLKQLSRYRQIG